MSVRTAHVRGAIACVVALAALLAALASASAERRPVLIVDATADGSGADAVRELEAQLAREDALGSVALDVVAALQRQAPPVDDWQGELTAALDATRAELGRFGYREAADRAHGALDRLARLADIPAARKQLAELALLEGQALVGAGAADRAALTLRLVHRLDPGRTLDPARYLPEVVVAYLAAGRQASASSEVHIAAPGAAEVLVDGVVVGREPVVLDVGPGAHLISARGEAIVTTGRRIDAPVGQAVRVDLVPLVAPLPVRVARILARLRSAPDDPALADAVATLLGLANARYAVVVVRGDAGLATRLYSARAGLQPKRELDAPDSVPEPHVDRSASDR